MPAKKTAKKSARKTVKKTAKKTSKKTTRKTAKSTAKKAPAKKVAKKVAKKTAKKTARKTVAKKAAARPVVRRTARKKNEAEPDVTVSPLYGDPYKFKKKESYMNEKQVAHFRNILRMWKDDLMSEVDRTVVHMKDEAANFPDPNDRASQETEFSLELRTRDRERKLIKKIDESIINLEAGDYGYCESCGIEIGVRRLEARPTATQCIDCKTLDEIREKTKQ